MTDMRMNGMMIRRILSMALALLMISAVNNRDMPLLLGSTVFATMIIIIGNMVADIMYSFLDPKIREQ